MRRDRLVPVLLVLVATVASVAIALVALDLATGVTRPRGRCCRTEFIDRRTLELLWLLHPLLGLTAALSWRLAMLGVSGVAVPQWLAMREVVERYADSGWGDGLEVLGYLMPIQTAFFGSVAVFLGALIGGAARRRRREGCDDRL